MTFESGEEETCRKYMETRGIYLYKQVYDALANWMPNVKEIKYKQFSNLIRYDKGIRDKLYIYLAAAEEYLRNIIFEELEIDNRPQDSTKIKLNISDLRTRTVEERNEESNLYYYEHTGMEVVVIDHRDLVRFFENFFIAGSFGGRPFQSLIRTGDSAFQLDVKVVMLPKLNDSFGKVHIDAESHASNKMVIAIFKIISNSTSKGLDILIVIGSFFFITPR